MDDSAKAYKPAPMQVLRSEQVDFYDCDDTLVMHVHEDEIPMGEKVLIQDPVRPGFHIATRINRNMVRLLRESHARGYKVVVWSRGGFQWAENVVDALGLRECVTLVCSKPMAYFDDSPIERWLPYRVYIGPDEIYKQQRQINIAKPTNKES